MSERSSVLHWRTTYFEDALCFAIKSMKLSQNVLSSISRMPKALIKWLQLHHAWMHKKTMFSHNFNGATVEEQLLQFCLCRVLFSSGMINELETVMKTMKGSWWWEIDLSLNNLCEKQRITLLFFQFCLMTPFKHLKSIGS